MPLENEIYARPALAPEGLTHHSSPAVPPSARLERRLAALRRQQVLVAVATGAAMAMAVSVELLALAMFLDWWLDLPWFVRLISLVLQLGTLAFILGRFVALPLWRQPDQDALALSVERARPEFRTRLISAMQLARPGAIPPGASVAMVQALVAETEAIADRVPFQGIVSLEKLKRLGALALLVLLLGIVGFVQGKAVCADLLKRALLSHVPVPRKTRVVVLEGDKVIGRGDAVRLEAFAQGLLPADGRLKIDYRSGRAQEFSLERDKETKGKFGRTLESVQDSFTYRIYLNDGVSAVHEVKTIPRPTVASMTTDQAYPSYTGLKPVRRSLGDLTLLAGSRLKLSITATKEIKAASLKLVGTGREIPLQANPANLKELNGEFVVPAKAISGFSVQMLDTEGMASGDSAVYRVDVLPDKAPAVRLVYPDRKEELITAQATLLLGFEATDDFAIAKVRLRYKVDTVEDGAARSVDLELSGENPQRLRRRHEWKIGALRPLLSEGSKIEFWIEAEDNNDATGPGVGSSEHQQARVVSESDKRADLLNRAGDYLGTINDVVTDQEKLNRSLGAIILERSVIK